MWATIKPQNYVGRPLIDSNIVTRIVELSSVHRAIRMAVDFKRLFIDLLPPFNGALLPPPLSGSELRSNTRDAIMSCAGLR